MQVLAWQGNTDLQTAKRRVEQSDRTAVARNNVTRDRQTKSDTTATGLAGLIQPVKGTKDLGPLCFRNAGTIIVDIDNQLILLIMCGQFNFCLAYFPAFSTRLVRHRCMASARRIILESGQSTMTR